MKRNRQLVSVGPLEASDINAFPTCCTLTVISCCPCHFFFPHVAALWHPKPCTHACITLPTPIEGFTWKAAMPLGHWKNSEYGDLMFLLQWACSHSTWHPQVLLLKKIPQASPNVQPCQCLSSILRSLPVVVSRNSLSQTKLGIV